MTTSTITEEETGTPTDRWPPGSHWRTGPVTSNLTLQATHIRFDDPPSQHRITNGRCSGIGRHR